MTSRRCRKPTRDNGAADKIAQGFTMVELMVVMLILGVLVALAAGIAGYLKETGSVAKTKTYQTILMGAVEAFNRNNGYYPPDPATYANRPAANAQNILDPVTGQIVGTTATFGSDPNTYWSVIQRSVKLAGTLRYDLQASPILNSLPKEAIDGTDPNCPFFLDAFGFAMDYRAAGGMAGRAVIVSGGATDGYMTSPSNSIYRPNLNTNAAGNPTAELWGGGADDIRTDGKKSG